MTFIEGIGDEVTQFFGILIIVVIGLLAWWSTGIADLPQIRTVLILERRSQTVTTQQQNLSQQSERLNTGQADGDICQQSHLTTTASTENKPELTVKNSSKQKQQVQGTSDGNVDVANSTKTETPTDDSPIPEHVSNSETDETPSEELDADNIRIRLKYLNDDQKLVEGRLQELLGDFKRRHFSMELSAQKLVRLIFNGQVLQREDQTLQGCGLYDNCVVHCLVHTQQNTNRNGQQRINSPPPDWNLGGVLYACLSLVLGLAWICRYNYSHLFTLTTTTALVGLTGMFAVSVISLYIPDNEHPSTT